MDTWSLKDPILNFEKFLLKEKVLTKTVIDNLKEEFKESISASWLKADQELETVSQKDLEITDIYKPFINKCVKPSTITKPLRLIDAISEGLKQSLQNHNNLIMMGQDIAEYGGVFKASDGFLDLFGKDRIRNTPICESSIVSAAYGLSIKGFKSIMEMQFADFASSGFNPIVNVLAKSFYRWGENADVVIRMPTGAGVGAGPFHSQSNEAWFTHTPGLKVVYPAFPKDAKGLLISSISDPNPVMFFEHKALYRSLSEEVPENDYTINIGEANLLSSGDDISIITYGMGVHWALEVIKEMTEISFDLIDLRTLIPLDKDMVFKSANKTGKIIVLHEDTMIGGFGSEISSLINEHCFENLDAPVVRCSSLDTPVPFSLNLEKEFLAKSRLKKQ